MGCGSSTVSCRTGAAQQAGEQAPLTLHPPTAPCWSVEHLQGTMCCNLLQDARQRPAPPTTVYSSCWLLEMWMGPAQNSVLRAAFSSGEQYLPGAGWMGGQSLLVAKLSQGSHSKHLQCRCRLT